MTTAKEGFALRGRNPDVLTCIANLSNDEIFTPPEFANKMLEILADAWAADHDGANIWADPRVTFLDPVTKSGVFLREITSRLTDGLKDHIPDLDERVDHILTKQVFGIGITYLTGLLARRSVYCSRFANGPHSIAKSFMTESGNVWFERMQHTWAGGSATGGGCKYCGASQKTFDRGEGLETHAYAFIHTDNIKARIAELFGDDMQFDVIIGNPPYQVDTGGVGRQAKPIYHKFVEQAKELDPRYLTMVIPARWFAGGMGLGGFRKMMLSDRRVRVLVDFIKDKDAFPTVNVNGGITYFLWDREKEGPCSVATVEPGGAEGEPSERYLDEWDVVVRRNRAVPILRKVRVEDEGAFNSRVSSLQPFGIDAPVKGASQSSSVKDIKLYGSKSVTWISRADVPARKEWIDEWKVFIPRASDGNEIYPLPIWDTKGPFVGAPKEVCTRTYMIATLAESEEEARRYVAYLRTKFVRFLVSLRKPTQDNKADNFAFVPDLPMDREWTDEGLYKRYGFSSDETAFIDTMIRSTDCHSG